MDNTNIGVAVAGRHPGYQVFGSVNWQGPAPVDADQRSRCLTDRYYSVAFDGFWANYELAMQLREFVGQRRGIPYMSSNTLRKHDSEPRRQPGERQESARSHK